jgi:hypothetical protein
MNTGILFPTCFHVAYLLGLFLDPEDGGDMFLRNIGLTFNGLHRGTSRCKNNKSYMDRLSL